MSDELKPCPFCGGEAKAFYCEESGTFDVQCQQCGAIPFIGSRTSERKTMADVIAAWNARAEHTCRIEPAKDGGWYCSECHVWISPSPMANATEYLLPRWCPNCGAKVVG